MIIEFSSKIELNKKVDLLKLKLDFALFTLKVKSDKNNNILKTLFIKTFNINELSTISFVLLDLDLNIIYETEPLIYFKGNKTYNNNHLKRCFIDNNVISNLYNGKLYKLIEYIDIYDLDLDTHFNNILLFLKKNNIGLDKLVLFEKTNNKNLIKIENESYNLFCLTNVLF